MYHILIEGHMIKLSYDISNIKMGQRILLTINRDVIFFL